MREGEHGFTPNQEAKESFFCRCPACKKAWSLAEGEWITCMGIRSAEHDAYYLGVKNGRLIHHSEFDGFKEEMGL